MWFSLLKLLKTFFNSKTDHNMLLIVHAFICKMSLINYYHYLTPTPFLPPRKNTTTVQQQQKPTTWFFHPAETPPGLPLYPMPEAFGLHENCNITCAQDEALRLLTGMQSMVPWSVLQVSWDMWYRFLGLDFICLESSV